MLRFAQAAGFAALLAACGGPPPPPPTKAQDSRTPVANTPRHARDPNSPFRRPDKDKPLPRSEPQIPAEEIDAALAASAAARAAGDNFEATRLLWPCANKIPKHTRCEGELALLLFDTPNHEIQARYFLEHAAADDDPRADADFYRRLGVTLRQAGMWRESAVAYRRMIARLPEPSAADWAQLAELLQGVPKHEAEAAEALHRAFELDPARLDFLRDEALLLAQIPARRAEALEILTRYHGSIKTTEPDKAAEAQRQIDNLQYEMRGTPAAPSGAGAATDGGKRQQPKTPGPGPG